MKYLYIIALALFALSACKKENHAGVGSGTTTVIPSGAHMKCSINGVGFSNDTTSQGLWYSYQSGSLEAYSIVGRMGDKSIRLYVPVPEDTTGTFSTPAMARIIYSDSLGDYYPNHDSGLVTIVRNDQVSITGTFQAMHTFQSYTRAITNGTFNITK